MLETQVGLERDVDDDGDLLFSGHAYVDSDKTSTQAHNFYILLLSLLRLLIPPSSKIRMNTVSGGATTAATVGGVR